MNLHDYRKLYNKYLDQPAFFTVKEFAAYRRVTPRTIIHWIKTGKIAAEQPAGKKGRYAIPSEMITSHPNLPPITLWPDIKP